MPDEGLSSRKWKMPFAGKRGLIKVMLQNTREKKNLEFQGDCKKSLHAIANPLNTVNVKSEHCLN